MRNIKHVVIREISQFFNWEIDKTHFILKRAIFYVLGFGAAALLTFGIASFFAVQGAVTLAWLFWFLFGIEVFIFNFTLWLIVTVIVLYYGTMIVKKGWYR